MTTTYRAVEPAHITATLEGVISTIAGLGSAGYSGDSGPAVDAELNTPAGPAVDASGNVYIADSNNHRVRKISPDGIITTVAGNGSAGYSGDVGPATAAQLNTPVSVTVDADGNLYIAERYNHRIRKVSLDGIITTVAGNGSAGYSGDAGPATAAQLNEPVSVAVDRTGALYMCDGANHRTRKVAPSGVITTIAGTGIKGYSGDDGPATQAQIGWSTAVAVDEQGTCYITDDENHRVRKITTDGVIATVVGNGSSRSSGDDGPAVSAGVANPVGVAVDARGTLYVAERKSRVVRQVTPDGTITTFAGDGRDGSSGDGGPATSARFRDPGELAVDSAGNLYVCDRASHNVRKVAGSKERNLTIRQGSVPLAKPGERVKFNLEITSPAAQAIDPGIITQMFTAPTGFVFEGKPSYGYYGSRPPVTGNLTHRIESDGKVLVVTGNPHVNTSATDKSPLVYTIPVRAMKDASPGTYPDGQAVIGRHPPVPLSGTITSPAPPTGLVVRQEKTPEMKPGETGKINVELSAPKDTPITGAVTQRFTAPTGFVFTGKASYGYYFAKPDRVLGTLKSEVSADGRTLTVTEELHLNTSPKDPSPLIYTLPVRALPDTRPGTRDDGRAIVGSHPPVPLSCTVKP
ncbi:MULTISPECIES: NHL repeat-containing protein [unclassified Streptomyces]|uniref:NHL repeat-containing protein n=1 Tax=unclassified Streptomyces TaxID=2593676 RepID=UPI002365E971|nr:MULTISPECIES: NHL repeat-containing protein [unclassified Streptomyces]MDF3140942.1 NHL repeat-containing protein [Streptomyces sp. T21Q-yed]WDF43607.1 NHL repeat-containing protein [Streptomyces sp. T12]